jgi:1-acyl-sn-glycerol-3-phosphate acyltransferase
VFPEGSRSPDGALKKFKAGIFLLAIENRFPVVPISIIGSRVVMPRGRPHDVSGGRDDDRASADSRRPEMTREDARALAERVRALIAAPVPVDKSL